MTVTVCVMGISVLHVLIGLLVVMGDIPRARGDSRHPRKTCQAGWTPLGRTCYKFVTRPASSWSDAKRDCEREGAQLLCLTSVSEVRKIKSQLSRKRQRTWWLGLWRNSTTDWQWLDKESFSYRLTPWQPEEPNNRGDAQGEEFCAEIDSNGKMNDKECRALRPFICEELPNMPDVQKPRFPELENERRGGRGEEEGKSEEEDDDDDEEMGPSDDDKGGKKNERGNQAKEEKEGDDEDLFETYAGCYLGNLRGKRGKENQRRAKPFQRYFPYTPGSRTCPPMMARRVLWPQTAHGVTVSRPCRNRINGTMTFACGGTPTCWRGEPNVDQCASKAFRSLLKRFPTGESGDRTGVPEPEETLAMMSELASITEGDDVTEDDVMATAKLLSAVRRGARKIKDRRKVKSIVANVMRAGSNLVSRKRRAMWTRMAPRDKVRAATSLLVAMETTTVAMAEELVEPTSILTKDDNMELELRVVNVTSSSSSSSSAGQRAQDVVYSAEGSDTHFHIPMVTLANLSSGGLAKMVFMTHYTMGDLLDDHDDDDDDSDDNNLVDPDLDESEGDVDDNNKDDEKEEVEEEDEKEKKSGDNATLPTQLASYVVSASVANNRGESMVGLPQPVSFTITHIKKIPQGFESICAFWSIGESGLGYWSQDGCVKVFSNESHTQCQCDHMTNFAVLMSVTEVKISEEHRSSLRVVTIVGCVISCLSLLASWITFTCFSSLQGERNSIHKNLAVCLFAAELLFLVGITQTENRVVCGVIAGFLHYLFLATFLWMMMEGVHIILMLVQVFDASRSRMPFYYAFAYVPPLLIIAVSAGVYSDGYGTENYCWLTTDRSFIWSFAGPVAAILFVNSVVLVYAMAMVCRHSDYVFNAKDKTSAGSVRSWIQGALALEVLLGLTWMLGFFFLSQQTVAMAYLFTVLNSTQGLYIFLFHCLLNKKVRKEYQRVLKLRGPVSSTGSGTQSASLRNKLTAGPSFNRHDNNHPHPPPSRDTSNTII